MPAVATDRSKVLIIAVAGPGSASARIRGWRFADALRERDLADAHVLIGPSRRSMLKIFLAHRQDVVLLQKWVPPLVVLLLLRAKARMLVYDCDDAIYLDVPQVEHPAKAASTRRRFRWLLRLIDAATVSVAAIESDLRAVRPSLPVLVFAGPRPEPASATSRKRSGLVWLGSPDTEQYLWPFAEEVGGTMPLIPFRAVGATARSAVHGIEVVDWSFETQRAVLSTAAFGLFVQPDGEWERRKSAYKILEYLSAGVLPLAERSPAAEALLGSDYPLLIDEGQLAEAVRLALTLAPAERQQLIVQALRATDRLSYGRVAARWMQWIATLDHRVLRSRSRTRRVGT